MKRYAIEHLPTEENSQVMYWTDRHNCWSASMPEAGNLLTGQQSDRELARLKESLPHASDRLQIVDVIVRKARAAIYGPASRAAITGKVRTPEALAAARAAGNIALERAGYRI